MQKAVHGVDVRAHCDGCLDIAEVLLGLTKEFEVLWLHGRRRQTCVPQRVTWSPG